MDSTLLTKYLAPGEDWRLLCDRVSGIMTYRDERETVFQQLLERKWLPNSPTLVNAGRAGNHNMIACHLLHVPNSIDGIFNTNRYAGLIFKGGGGVGLELSELSPCGTALRYAPQGKASGPVSFMKVFNTTAQVVMEGGLRRAAILATLNVTHPDIELFIKAKTVDGDLRNFNISVTLNDGPDAVSAELWRKIIECTHNNGEPGIIFLDNVNKENPTVNDFGPIKGANPCAEAPMYDGGSCVLASVVLPNVIDKLGNWFELQGVVRTMVQFLNRVIDMNHYPLPQIAQMTRRDRRIGIGVMGWADLLRRHGISFASKEANTLAREICQAMYEAANEESWALAKRDGGYLPNRRRNATLMAIAPTGHISRLAGASYSIYPEYSEGLELTPEQHLDAIKAWAFVDNAVSYTVCYPHSAELSIVDRIYRGAWERGLKSISCYRDMSREGQPLCKLNGECQ